MAKILVSLDQKLLVRIDRAARKLGLTRSGYLARLAARELDTEGGPGRDPKVRQAVSELKRLFAAHPLGADPTDVIRQMRDSR